MKYYRVDWVDTFDYDHYTTLETEETLRIRAKKGSSNMQRVWSKDEITKEEYYKYNNDGENEEIEIVNGRCINVSSVNNALNNCIAYLVILKGIELKKEDDLFDAVAKIVTGG